MSAELVAGRQARHDVLRRGIEHPDPKIRAAADKAIDAQLLADTLRERLAELLNNWTPPPAPQRRTLRIVQPCGTVAAYQRHLARRETPCGECEAAKRADNHNRYRAEHPPLEVLTDVKAQRDKARAVAVLLHHELEQHGLGGSEEVPHE